MSGDGAEGTVPPAGLLENRGSLVLILALLEAASTSSLGRRRRSPPRSGSRSTVRPGERNVSTSEEIPPAFVYRDEGAAARIAAEIPPHHPGSTLAPRSEL